MTSVLDGMLTPEQLAKRWKMSPGTLKNWRAKKKGPPFVPLGDGPRPRVLYKLVDVEAWEAELRKGAAA